MPYGSESRLEVILSPAEFPVLQQRDLRDATCVVFDILRATTSIIAALANGADSIIPVEEISEAVSLRRHSPELLLAGERAGLRILADQTGSIDFDLGNSPREFTRDRVAGKTIVITTTNGTRALRACAHARTTLVSAFLNLRATIDWLRANKPQHLILVCAGTHDEPALEDLLAASAVCGELWDRYRDGHVSDSAQIARSVSPLLQLDPLDAMGYTRNGRRLLASPEFREDVSFSIQRDTASFVAALDRDGRVRVQGARGSP
jgi:2-phosphosulfolactate phosphatase